MGGRTKLEPVHGKRVFKAHLHFAEIGWPLEKRPFRFRRRHFGAEAGRSGFQPRCALALLSMVMSKQHPFDLPHADFHEMLQDAAVAQVNEQGRFAVPQHINIAGIRPNEEVGQQGRSGPLECGWVGLCDLLAERWQPRRQDRKKGWRKPGR